MAADSSGKSRDSDAAGPDVAEVVGEGGKRLSRLGILTLVLGFLTMLAPAVVGLSVLWVLGILVMAAGLLRMYWAFQTDGLGRGIPVFLIGILTVVAGIVLLANPLIASGALTIILGLYFLVDGAAELATAFQLRGIPGRGWLFLGGAASMLLGIVIWRQFPLSGVVAIGVLLGIKLLFCGMIMASFVRAATAGADPS